MSSMSKLLASIKKNEDYQGFLNNVLALMEETERDFSACKEALQKAKGDTEQAKRSLTKKKRFTWKKKQAPNRGNLFI
jgi:translation elongation factor EF-Ts